MVLCWMCVDTATLAGEELARPHCGHAVGDPVEREVMDIHWWDGRVILVMVVMEWANAVSSRRCGEGDGS